jgi:uncharacterized damage-inducible protein DinB
MKAHFQTMAAYNRWANARLYDAAGKLSQAELDAPRSGFFPSLMKTLNHVLVGDTVWMARLEGIGHPGVTRLDQTLHTDFAALRAARGAMDARFVAFAGDLTQQRLGEMLVYHNMAGEPMQTRVDHVLAHVFNHQTHHRGQAHAMLSSTEVAPPPLDLIYYLRDAAKAG